MIKQNFRHFGATKTPSSGTEDQSPLFKISAVVYNISCSDCQGVYVGETSQYLQTRMSHQKHDIETKIYNNLLLCPHMLWC